ncbi:MAG: hypothetical protein WC599_13195 [Bacteroidales bacterium]
MGKKVLMIYNLNGKDSERIKLNRVLFQYKTQSHKGKYETISKGVLKEYEKPVRSVVIFDKTFLNKVKKIMAETKIIYKIYEITDEIQ